MIPTLNRSGFLPPFLPNAGPTQPAAMAPYSTNLAEVVSRFASTPERQTILRGFLSYRRMLRDAGIRTGFQWIDGSYVENCEQLRNRPPSDIDIVTFAERPASCIDDALWLAFFQQNRGDLFNPEWIKSQHHCHAFYIDLGLPGRAIVSNATYWFGLFSHERATNLWKGLLEVPLQADDQAALALLTGGTSNAP